MYRHTGSLTHLGVSRMPVLLSQIFLWLSTSYTRKRARINDATDLLTFDVSWCFIIASPGEERAKKWALCPFERQKTPAVSRCGRYLRRWTNGRFLHPGAPATFVDKVDWIMLGVRSLACTCLFLPKTFLFSSFGIPRVSRNAKHSLLQALCEYNSFLVFKVLLFACLFFTKSAREHLNDERASNEPCFCSNCSAIILD